MTRLDGTLHYSAPGRINLIGEHTDYNFGFALPIALPERTRVTFQPEKSDSMVVRSDREPDVITFPLGTAPGDVTGWAAYVAGVVWALQQAGHPVPGGALSIAGGVAAGAGLASSAALECAVLGAVLGATDRSVDLMERARIAQRAENEYVGAPTGLLDQLAVLYGAPRRAQMIDFANLTVRPVLFDPDASGIALLLIDSRAAHQHADGEYAARRASCERAATELKVGTLREVQDQGLAALATISGPEDARRARHIVTENRRVIDFVDALAVSDFTAAGRVLTDSHVSMRDDFEITTEHLDLIADTAVASGALGARMTGGGFGGCVISLVDNERVETVAASVRDEVGRRGYPAPVITRTRAGDGAGASAYER
ncbi:galactokinase [Mycolicibacterium rhodesiae]|uniref:Galactokinase n=1 Tax=Mycolicibacterium rhodesiae TaxID=36814 RepID=A0A1X0J2X8_MYCRH|nr:galactokinase [Mycolicibacterium rhodesiae]MCV7348001.1 galactokinase [Mycolicibacterium rhodesiae]ORB56142.1 galactokinase [Mycolicibacterium rhodesiae]